MASEAPIATLDVAIVTLSGAQFHMSLEAANTSGTLKHLIADLSYKQGSEPIPVLIPNCDDKFIAATVAFCEKYAHTDDHSDFTVTDQIKRTTITHLAEWQAELIKPFETSYADLEILHSCADYLDIPELILLIGHAVARAIAGKTTPEMQKWMGVDPEDTGFTAEQKSEIAMEQEFIARIDAAQKERAAAQATAPVEVK